MAWAIVTLVHWLSEIAQTLYFPIKSVLLSSVTKSVPEKVYTENGKIAPFFTPLVHFNHFPVV